MGDWVGGTGREGPILFVYWRERPIPGGCVDPAGHFRMHPSVDAVHPDAGWLAGWLKSFLCQSRSEQTDKKLERSTLRCQSFMLSLRKNICLSPGVNYERCQRESWSASLKCDMAAIIKKKKYSFNFVYFNSLKFRTDSIHWNPLIISFFNLIIWIHLA